MHSCVEIHYCTKYAFFFLELFNNLVTEKSLLAVACIHLHNHINYPADSVDPFSISSAPKLLQDIGYFKGA